MVTSSIFKHYNELNKEELYSMLHLRAQVFVVEQNCPFNDLDYLDQTAYHLFLVDENDRLIGVSRIIPPGELYIEASIGRICIPFDLRHSGLGRSLVIKSIEKCKDLYNGAIKIMAQHYLQGFYESFGFVAFGDTFLEDDILHIYMLKE